tara:strand:- start:288 stop:491 length:204 start_codon:yes stop_codon:yes gene_type:complete
MTYKKLVAVSVHCAGKTLTKFIYMHYDGDGKVHIGGKKLAKLQDNMLREMLGNDYRVEYNNPCSAIF